MTVPSKCITIECNSPDDTAQIATSLAGSIPPGTTVALSGTLGAGKTFFAQRFSEACGVAHGSVVSPTFVICQQHEGQRFRINHLDVYRLNDGDEFIDLGAEEMMESDSVQLIEWADRVTEYLPDRRLELEFTVTGESSRLITIVAYGDDLVQLLADLRHP